MKNIIIIITSYQKKMFEQRKEAHGHIAHPNNNNQN